MEKGQVFGIGETVYDIIFKDDAPQRAVPGGSTFNALVSLGRVGVPCNMVSEVGDDHVAELIYKYLIDNGVGAQYVYRHAGAKSHISLAFLDEKNDAHYTFYKDYARVRVECRKLDICNRDFVLFGSFFAINPAIRPYVKSMLEQAHRAGAFIYYDLNFRESHIAEIPQIISTIEENMRLASLVRGSLDDFSNLYGTKDVEKIYEEYVQPLCPYFICTNGSETIYLRTPSIRASFPVAAIETVSTIGAGDNFNAGFIYALRRMAGKTLQTLSLDDWTGLIDTGQLFAQDVCRQFNNSVSESFAQRMRD